MDNEGLLKGKKALVFGERDDIPAATISNCLKDAGAEIIYETTACFVWTAAGAVGLTEQEVVKSLADEHGAENLIVIFGINQPSTLQIMTRTFTSGDPSYAGPLTGVALGLACYHIFELKAHIQGEVWEAEMSMYELQAEEDEKAAIIQAMNDARGS